MIVLALCFTATLQAIALIGSGALHLDTQRRLRQLEKQAREREK